MASALLHMSCTQLKNDSVIGRMDDSYDEAYSELGRAKRDHDTDDVDRCQVKKRRKQSKPIRITSSESLPFIEVKSAAWVGMNQSNQNPSPPQNFQDEYLKLRDSDRISTEVENKTNNRNESDAEGSNEESCFEQMNHEIKKEFVYPLNLSHTKSPSPKDSVDSFTGEDRNWYKAPEGSPLYPLHPLDPGSLRNQVYQNNILIPSQTPGIVLPNFKRIFVSNNETQISSPHRIFNPEAFCDLCNKEFCNKYFLKTHKANKHGIYLENVGSSSVETLPTLPMINYFSNNLANTNNLPMINYFSNNMANKKNPPSFPPPPPVNKTNSSSMRAFCNICQREFCNKYFVRRHKAKIHGIIETSDESQEYKSQMSQEKPESNNDVSLPGPSSTGKPANKEVLVNKDVPEVPLEEERERGVKKELDNEPEMPDSPQNALNLLVSTWQNEDCKDGMKSPDRNKKPPSIPGTTAFCDICCKEYCNKYFLRVHKQKCHGIVISEKDDRIKDTNSNSNSSSANNAYWKTNQPMPLNLILRENNKNENESVFSCNICNISFPEPYLLKLHSTQVHNQTKSQDVSQPQYQNTYVPVEQKVNKASSVDLSPQACPEQIIKNSQSESNIENGKTIGAEVQKLHSMIMKLNQQGQLELFSCDICNKDFGRGSSLENHIIKDHAGLLEQISNGVYEDNSNIQTGTVKFDCSKCPKYFPTMSLLEHHLGEKHSVYDSKINIRNGDETPESSPLILQGERPIVHTPTSSFCEICKKELCNKYFMKTHMQRMHGISIENGAHIGGVVCDICNKELCSKYFLRVHKQNSHGIVEEAFLPQIGTEVKNQISNADSALKPTESELTHRYFSHFTEVCTICSRRFRSVKWLKTHLLNDHGEEGKDKWREVQLQNGNKSLDKFTPDTPKKVDSSYFSPTFRNSVPDEPSTSYQSNETLSLILNKNSTKQYQCSYCSFSTTGLALLFVHERTHFPNSADNHDLRCPLCMADHDSQEALEVHINSHHSLNNISSKLSEENSNFSSQHITCEPSLDITEKDVPIDDNNYNETSSDSKLFVRTVGEACVKCTKCPFTTNHLEIYVEHIKKEHRVDEINKNYFQIIRDALLQIANSSLVPASFAIPNNIGNFVMQPFILEDKGIGPNNSSTFLSSLVFLPVKERLNKPVTASFKLTPT